MSFQVQMAGWGERASKRVEHVLRGTSLKLFSAVIKDTPVDTGRLRANWRTSIESPLLEERDGEGGPAIREAVAEMSDAVARLKGDQTIIITNNLPYARRIEYEGWSKKKSPEGMVRKNVTRFRRIIKDQIQEVK